MHSWSSITFELIPVVQEEFPFFLSYHAILQLQFRSSILFSSGRAALYVQCSRNAVSCFFMKVKEFKLKIDCNVSRNLRLRFKSALSNASTSFFTY